MGILVESNANASPPTPPLTAPSSIPSEFNHPEAKKFYDFPVMNQYVPPPGGPPHPPLPPHSVASTGVPTSSPTSTTDMMPLPPPPPHGQLYPLPGGPMGDNWPLMPPGPGSIPPPSLSDNSLESGGLPPLCAGCRLRIEDKFYLSAVDVKWHSACLKCAECGVELETQSSCFERDGHIYCKEDYRRIYNVNKCARCLQEIQSSDLVMKARQFLFHVDCFCCDTCGTLLKKGDLFGMYEDHLYCRSHYEMATAATLASSDLIPLPHHGPPGVVTSNGPFTPDPMCHSPDGGAGQSPYGRLHLPFPPPPGPGGFPPGAEPPPVGWYPPPGDYPGGPMGGPGGGPGGPGGEFQYDNNNEPMLKKRRGRKKRKVETFAAMNGYLEASGYPPGMDGQGGPGKTKRARTSFKHHQLRIMKHHFQINQNPDSRELKILSQKTQLDKKVLQVWFQNARAKWRRTKAQDGGGGGPSAPGSHTNNPSASLTSASASAGGPGGLGSSSSGNPDDSGDLGLGSPSSDCSSSMIPCC